MRLEDEVVGSAVGLFGRLRGKAEFRSNVDSRHHPPDGRGVNWTMTVCLSTARQVAKI
jgi:hypothetical protein